MIELPGGHLELILHVQGAGCQTYRTYILGTPQLYLSFFESLASAGHKITLYNEICERKS